MLIAGKQNLGDARKNGVLIIRGFREIIVGRIDEEAYQFLGVFLAEIIAHIARGEARRTDLREIFAEAVIRELSEKEKGRILFGGLHQSPEFRPKIGMDLRGVDEIDVVLSDVIEPILDFGPPNALEDEEDLKLIVRVLFSHLHAVNQKLNMFKFAVTNKFNV